MSYHCTNCGKIGHGRPGQGPVSGEEVPRGWVTTGFMFGRRAFCSNKCKDEFNTRNQQNENNNNSQTPRGANQSQNQRVEKSPEQILAESEAELKKRKEVKESDARFFDGIKKLILYKKNKEAKILHSKLEEIETEIVFAMSKGKTDDVHRLLKTLKHDSNFFLPNTNTSYNNYWTTKRDKYLSELTFEF